MRQKIPKLMPLKRAVSLITQEADPNDEQEIRRAVKRWHNKLSNGSIPRTIFKKIGKELYLDLRHFEKWLRKQEEK